MRYTSTINNVKALKWKLNIPQAYLFSWIYELPSWASKMTFENEVYYFASKNKAVEEMPMLTKKVDTMYRYYKQLENKGLIVLKKVDGRDYIALTEKAKTWNDYKSDHSEINPNALGNKSESNSEIFPTYNNTIYDNTIIDKESAHASNSNTTSLKDQKEKEKNVPPKKESWNTAFEWLEQNAPMALEAFEMRYKRKIYDYDLLKERFNNQADAEELVFSQRVIMGRLNNYALSWINNQKKNNVNKEPEFRHNRPQDAVYS